MKEIMDDQIKIIRTHLKKKKRNVAKNLFMDLVHELIFERFEMEDEITDEDELIFLKSKLDDMNSLFSMIWKYGIEFKDNFMEWRILRGFLVSFSEFSQKNAILSFDRSKLCLWLFCESKGT